MRVERGYGLLRAPLARTANPMNIVSFLPAATEMVYSLGMGDHLVGVSHECDYPAEARSKPVVVRCALELDGLPPREVDRKVSERLRRSGSIYEVDEGLLKSIAPDLILTQDLCQVCAPSGTEVATAIATLRPTPDVLWMTPKSLDDILQNILDLGTRSGQPSAAQRLVTDIRNRLQTVETAASGLRSRPRVFCMEWVDPVFCAGHWVPEMVELAGGVDDLARRGTDSRRISWAQVVRWAPEVLVVAPCGLHLSKAREEAHRLTELAGWKTLPAVQEGRVFAIDASSYVSRPGPRVGLGVQLLAHLIHPDTFPWSGPREAFERVDL